MSRIIDFIDRLLSQSRIMEKNGVKVVIKKYDRESGFIKWITVKTASLMVPIYPYTFSPRERMRREVEFFTRRPGNVNVPKILEVNNDKLYIVREYVDGEVFSPTFKPDYWSLLAEALYRIHRDNYVMGDSKYTNFMIKDRSQVYVIDAEQAIYSEEEIHRAWDILVFLVTTYYPLLMYTIDPWNHKGVRKFIEGYANLGGVDTLDTLTSEIRLKTIANVLLPFPQGYLVFKTIRDIIRR